MQKDYPSKVSYGLLTFVGLVFYGPLVPSLIADGFSVASFGLLALLTVLFAFIAHLFLKTVYTIDSDKLKIKCGVFSFKPIDIDEIRAISKTKSVISAPAPSLDRIKLKYGECNEVILSPKDKFQFAKDLTRLNQKIKNELIE